MMLKGIFPNCVIKLLLYFLFFHCCFNPASLADKSTCRYPMFKFVPSVHSPALITTRIEAGNRLQVENGMNAVVLANPCQIRNKPLEMTLLNEHRHLLMGFGAIAWELTGQIQVF